MIIFTRRLYTQRKSMKRSIVTAAANILRSTRKSMQKWRWQLNRHCWKGKVVMNVSAGCRLKMEAAPGSKSAVCSATKKLTISRSFTLPLLMLLKPLNKRNCSSSWKNVHRSCRRHCRRQKSLTVKSLIFFPGCRMISGRRWTLLWGWRILPPRISTLRKRYRIVCGRSRFQVSIFWAWSMMCWICRR